MIQATLPEKKRAALSRELSEFLIELSIAVHRYAMYPPGHPSLGPAVENVVGRLAEIFEKRRAVSIGVAHRQLVIEGVATDPRHPVLSDLARRLHNHQLGALSFAVGTNAREIEGMLTLLAHESEREGEPVGLTPDRIPTWEHARVYPVGYEQLEMKSSPSEDDEQHMDRATQLWLGLAQSALASDEPVDPTATPDAKSLAAAIDGHRREAAYDQVIVGYLLQLADELKTGEGGEAEKVRRRVSSLVNELSDGTLARLVEMGGNEAQRRQFLLDANQGLAVDAVVKVLRAAAEGGGQSISTSMTRLLSKLAVHADKGNDRMRARADTALRENVEELIADWKLADPNPDQYTAVLDAMAKSSPLFQIRVERDDGQITGPMRVVQLALEVDAWGPTVQTAVNDLLGMGMASSLIQLIDQTPLGTKVADEVRKHLTSPAQLKRVLSVADVDEGTLQMLIERMGSAAIPPLLDVLADSDSRSVRRKVFDRLVKMGPEVGERAVERLADGRWFVIRNMLALMQRLETLPGNFDPAKLLEHPDERVRRESIPLALRKGVAGRERVVAAALAETDERTVRMALIELQKDLPETLVPVVVNRVVRSERSQEIRALGARALGNSRSNLALDVLLGLSIEGKSLMGRIKLCDKSPLLIAAIQTLAKAWPADVRSREVLALASRSKDADVRKAAEPAAGVA